MDVLIQPPTPEAGCVTRQRCWMVKSWFEFRVFLFLDRLLYKIKKKDISDHVKFLCQHVIYSPSTEQSIKRCTCVNKRKNSGSRWTLNNNITRCTDGSSQLETRCRSENQSQTEGFAALSDPRLSNLAKMRKKCCYGRGRTWVNIAVCPCLQLISHIQETSPFRE